MVKITRRIYFFKIHENWFADQLRFLNPFSLRAYMNLRDCRINLPFVVKEIYPTIENLLTIDPETIFAGFSSSNRTKIRKAERDGVMCEFQNDKEKFINYYNDFAPSKNIPFLSNERLLQLGNNIVMSFAVFNGQILAAHSFLIDQNAGIARGEFSATSRFDVKADASLASRANKLLHFKDMLYLKEKGFKIYNWGGYFDMSDGSSLLGIKEFKLSFGGKEVNYANYYSLGYYLLRKVARFTGLVGRRNATV